MSVSRCEEFNIDAKTDLYIWAKSVTISFFLLLLRSLRSIRRSLEGGEITTPNDPHTGSTPCLQYLFSISALQNSTRQTRASRQPQTTALEPTTTVSVFLLLSVLLSSCQLACLSLLGHLPACPKKTLLHCPVPSSPLRAY